MLAPLLHVLGAAAAASVADSGGVRQVASLDGEWHFTLQQPPAGAGSGTQQSGTILVPGSWEAQGYGNESLTMRAQVVTGTNAGAVGTYSKQLALPPCKAAGARTVFMIDQGIHRHAIFKIGGKVVGEHTGYMTPFEHVLDAATAKACRGSSGCEVEITLDGNRHCDKGGCADALMGCMDDDIDAAGPGAWAGLNGHVDVECRPAIHIDGGVGNIVGPHVTHPPVTTASAGKPLTLGVAFLVSGGAAPAAVHIYDNATGTLVLVARSAPDATAVSGNVTLHVTIPQVKLWSPEVRALYTAVVTLGPMSAPLDAATSRFGVRTATVDGYKIMLNGQRLFLAGYGDDAIYPITLAMPREKSGYTGKVKFAHKHGFNFVRHHSHTPPPEYFDATDEWGILVSPELPCAYGNFFTAGNATAQALYLASWTSYIAAYRNHPSVLTWTLCNEMAMPATFKLPGSEVTFGSEIFYKVKQALDPSRLMNDQDGACGAGSKRDSLSFCSHQFDVGSLGCIGYTKSGSCVGADLPTKYHDAGTCRNDTHACAFSGAPNLPVISHETGNYNTYPRIQSVLDKFNTTGAVAKPYWISQALTKLNASGLSAEANAWATASEQLYVLCWKIDVEDQRHNTMISGYEWWLIQDYWTASNGIVDMFMQPKPGVANYIAQFNARSIFLEDGLQLTYISNETLSVDISLSNFGDGALPAGTHITWSILMNGKSIKSATVPSVKPVPQGEMGIVASIEFMLPDVGTSASVPFGGPIAGPKSITVTAAFAEQSATNPAPLNSWNTTLFPRWVSVPSPTKDSIQVTDPALQAQCGFSDCKVSNWNSTTNPSDPPVVYLTTKISDALLQRAKEGSAVVLVEETSSGFFKSAATRFKQAWWLGNDIDNNAGTLVYDDAAPVLAGMAPDKYGDQTWFRMINGAQTFLMDEWPTLPGSWSSEQKGTYGTQDGCSDDVGSGGCPLEFPFKISPSGVKRQNCNALCYKTVAEANAGEGPCGSWCTVDTKTTGCSNVAGQCGGKNACPPPPPPPPAPGPGLPPAPAPSASCEFLQDVQLYDPSSNHTKPPVAAKDRDACCGVCMADRECFGAELYGESCYVKTAMLPQVKQTSPAGVPLYACIKKNQTELSDSAAAATARSSPTVTQATQGKRTSCKPAVDVAACQARCDASTGCSAVNFNSSHGCCLEHCVSKALGPPKYGGGCCGYFPRTGEVMPRDITVMMRAIDIVGLSRNKLLLWSVPIGKGHIIATGLKLLSETKGTPPHPEQAWVLDRLLRYAGSLIKQEQ